MRRLRIHNTNLLLNKSIGACKFPQETDQDDPFPICIGEAHSDECRCSISGSCQRAIHEARGEIYTAMLKNTVRAVVSLPHLRRVFCEWFHR